MDSNTTMSTYEMLTGYGTLTIAIANSIMLGIIFFTYKQYVAYQKTSKEDHERSRRELALKLLMHWDTNMQRQGTIARKLVENFNDDLCKKLKLQEEFSLEAKYIDLLKGSINHLLDDKRRDELDENKKSGQPIIVNQQESAELRWAVVSYLNSLEVILSGWKNNICDREMISEQFQFLFSSENNQYILENLRKELGYTHTYPNIYAFIEQIKEDKLSSSTKSALGS